MNQLNSKQILQVLKRHFIHHDYKLFNAYMYAWECDFWALSKSKYAIEIEVKISRSDFFADFKKEKKHKVLTRHKRNFICLNRGWGGATNIQDPETGQIIRSDFSDIEFVKAQDCIPNKFYYAVPTDIISVNEIPSYAGLLYIDGYSVTTVKTAPFLHKEKIDRTKSLLDKYYYKHLNMPLKMWELNNKIRRHLSEEALQILDDFMQEFNN